MSKISLIHDFEFDITRPVADMAAFFAYELDAEAGERMQVSFSSHKQSINVLLTLADGARYSHEELCQADLTEEGGSRVDSGEVVRCLKIAVVGVLQQRTGRNLRAEGSMPWGILTGVRPGKLAHKLLDGGKTDADGFVQTMEKSYLLPVEQGMLLRDICLLQKQLLPDATRFRDGGIYIGVPFCPSRCTYCSFPAGIVPQDEESQQNFVNLIEQDVKNVVQLLGMHSLDIKSVYIGGGTPTSLGERPFARLLKLVERFCLECGAQEFTVEAGRPDCFSEGKLKAMEAAGVNRISVNPQTFHDRTLAIIGRRHSVDDFYRAYEMVRKSSIPVINMDLIIGLPQETEADIAYSLEKAAELAPENLTIHTLTLKKNAPLFRMQGGNVLSTQSAASMVERGRGIAASLGMRPYYLYRQHYMLGHLANIGYALPGTESVYNIQMMEERHPIIGIGPASASKNPLPDGHHLNKLNMPRNVKAYTNSLQELFRKRMDLFM